MTDLLRFVTGVVATALEPMSAIGYIAIGAVSKRVWQAAVGGAVWAIAMDMLVRTIDLVGYSGYLMPQRMAGGVIVATAVYWMKAFWLSGRTR